MDCDDGLEDEGPFSSWLPPDDRLWRHPSEVAGAVPSDRDATRDFDTAPGLSFPSLEHAQVGPKGHFHGAVATVVRTGPVRTWTVAVVAGVVGALLASGVTMATGNFGTRTTLLQNVTRIASPDTVALAVPARGATPVPNWPSVASVLTASVVAVLSSSGASGSGVLYAARRGRSYILTTDDLAGGHAEVTFDSGAQEAASLVDTDPTTGLALMSVAGDQRDIPTFGSVANLRVAEPLLAVTGNEPQGTTDFFSVSSVDEAATVSDDQTLVGMLAVTGSTDAQDGGALVDAQGHVMGITTTLTATDPMQQGTSYAIPIDLAAHIAQQLLIGEKTTHPYLGVLETEDVSSVYARQLGIAGGAQVESVAPGSQAAAAGISTGDVITAMNGVAVTSAGSMIATLCDYSPGSSVTVRYLHQGKSASVTVQVSEEPGDIDNPDG